MDSGRIIADYDAQQKGVFSPEACKRLGLRALAVCDPSGIMKPCPANCAGIEFRNLFFAYQKEEPILNMDRLLVPEKRISALVGCNGIGKTTFLNCISGIQKRARGSVHVQGRELSLKAFGKRVFLVMQDVNHQLFTESVLAEVLISMDTPDEQKADEILFMLDLSDLRDRHPMSLSGGQKQRVAIACAFASGRDVLLFDEPTSGLDARHMEMTAQLLHLLTQMGKTVLVVTHDSELIACCCDCVLHLGR